jgi:hypothetical protein
MLRDCLIHDYYSIWQSFSEQAIASDSDSDWSPKFGLGLKKSWLSYTLTQNYQSMNFFCEMLTSLEYKCVNKQTRWVRVRRVFKVRNFRTQTRTSEKLWYMVQFYRQLLYIRENSLSHKTKQPIFHLGIFRNDNHFYKIVDIFQTF